MGKILRIALLFVSLLCCVQSWAQTAGTVITGTVSDDKGVTLPGVTVTLKNTKTTAVTDINGKYRITVPGANSILVFAFIGLESKEVAVGAKTVLDVTLGQGAAKALNDVVVIGYGTQKRGDVNGAITSVTAAQIADLPQPSVDQMLQGKAAGVTVVQNSGAPGSNTSVRVRGVTAFGSSEPLYVIDGVERQGSAPTAQLGRPGGGQDETGVSALATINPDDIESIDILKDASATAIYGSRGANGVIIITTKRGKNGAPVVTYDGFVGIQKQGRFIDMMNLQQYATLQNRLAPSFRIQPRAEFADPSVLGPGTDWQKAIFRSAFEQSHNVSISGATNITDFYVSGGYFKQTGTIIGSDFDRYSIRANVNSQAKPWLKMGTTFGASRSNTNAVIGNNTGVVYYALLASPDQAVYNADGSFAGPQEDINGQRLGGVNPVQQALSVSNKTTRNNVNGNLYAEIRFLKDFNLRSEVSADFNWNDAQVFNPTYSYGAPGSTNPITNNLATLNRLISNSTYWSWKETLNYTHTFGKHSVNGLIGRDVWMSTYNNVPLSGSNFIAGNSIQSIALANTVGSNIAEQKGTTTMESYLARLIYTFNNKYSITANIRSDKTSNFAEGHQTGYFPGVAVSWRLSDESFMASTKSVVDNIKIRAGYGAVGNSNVPQYVYGASLRAVATAFGTGFILNNVANPNLTWQHALQKNIGVDFTLFNRIDGAFDYYVKTSSKFLFQQPLPYFLLGGPNEYDDNPAGIQPPYINAGEIRNAGFDLAINSRNIVSKNFKWSTNLTLSHYNNKVTSLNGAPEINTSITSSYVSFSPTRTTVGYPVGEFYGYKVQGVVKTEDQLRYLAAHPQNVTGSSPQIVTNDPNVANSIWLGDLQYVDVNGDGKVDVNDRTPLGSPNPTLTYGFTNTFNYKDFDLSLFFYGSYGGKILNVLRYQTEGLGSLYLNQTADAANFWTPANSSSNIPAPRAGIDNPNLVMSDRFLESASFLRLQNARVGYTLPSRWAKYAALRTLKVYVSGQNLFVITKYKGLDPEVGSLNQNPTLSNIDLGRYPNPRIFTFGVNASF
ncbi:TonB-dependent receptor [Mucilaginibacter sp. Bleaf8]|uniref:SusC/RagA family TonB-linked outer membrane protein n=1 Tax=Mucilaginibacter sp. Bleaf8 TaxID=2834430 RepID=UPI001BCF62F8|nr:TonB-dependent receptor [Mucilaginibacter sp. Bleaf8]MBS7566664.1 TonB-dependent receptor [Mucilaginibacter sp. Bleaf8]